MKRKFSLFVTIVVCLLLVVGILSACNDDSEQDPGAHVHSMELTAAKEATCTEGGNNAYYHCSGCNKYFKDEAGTQETTVEAETIPAAGHNWDNGEITTAATCTTDGVMTYTCLDCAETKIETSPALGHGMTIIKAKDATCTEEGNNEYYYCSECNKYFKDIEGEEETTVAAETIPATGHNWNNGEITTAATCTTDGVKTYTCLDCGETKIETIPALGHGMTIIEANAATCTEAGNNAYYHCSRCDKYFKDIEGEEETTVEAEIIPATGHKWNNGEITTAATCTEDGVMTYTCLDCGETKTETTAATGHKWDEGEITTATTCTEDGVMTFTCSNCNETRTETIPAGHVIVDGVCTVCGELIYTVGLEYELSGDKTYYIVTGIGTASGDIIIPDTHEGLPVTYIGSNAFSYCSNLESVTFAEGSGLTSFGSSAFEECSSLTSIDIPSGVTTIGGDAFYDCSNLESVTFAEGSELTSIGWSAFYGCSSLTSIEIPAGVTDIGNSAFYGCSNLERVTFAEGSRLTTIGWYAFEDCSSLTSIEIPAGVTSIGSSAFRYCSSLTSIEIPAGVTSIGDWAFNGCSILNTVYYAGSIEDWLNIEFESSTSNPLYDGADLYIDGELVTEVVVPESITTIGYQLTGCTSLTSITIHSGVTSTRDRTFSGCSNLESVTFAEGSQLTNIGYRAFYGCSSLTSIDIPAGVTSIGDRAFYECSSLTSIEIPAGVTSIGDYAFYRCSSLETIYYNGTVEQWNSIDKGANWDLNCGNYEVVFLGDAGAEGGEG